MALLDSYATSSHEIPEFLLSQVLVYNHGLKISNMSSHQGNIPMQCTGARTSGSQGLNLNLYIKAAKTYFHVKRNLSMLIDDQSVVCKKTLTKFKPQ